MEQGNNSVIGIHDGHNSAIALVKDGRLDFAQQEERLTRIKNQGNMPVRCLFKAFGRCNHRDNLYFSWEGKNIVSYE